MNSLDRPVWSSLTTAHVHLSEGDEAARRYAPDVNMFAAARDQGEQAQQRLAGLAGAGQSLFLVEAAPISPPPGMTVQKEALCIQMTGRAAADVDMPEGTHVLSEADAPDMLALAKLTEPGPFEARTHLMGRFVGVRIDGRLAAMAGERMRFPGYTEVSGVCTHPDFRGRGLARGLSAHVAATILGRGDIPFLHSWATNTAAIRLYEGLGFQYRADINTAVVREGG